MGDRPITRALRSVEELVTGTSGDAVVRPALIAAAGVAVYGLAMGSFSVDEPGRAWFMLFAAIKTPMLLAITTLVCLPAYAAVVLAAGLREDLWPAIARLVRAQATGAVVLASLAPVVIVAYTGVPSHAWAILVNAGVFAIGAGAGQLVAWRAFGPLIARHRRHLLLLALWFVAYAFVGVQLGWTLRPFVGTPGTPAEFFREEAFTNAYVAVFEIIRDAAGL